jgi:DnaB-like helicase N terminal domain/AAA domain
MSPSSTRASDLEKPLPQNIEAERSVLGAILLDNRALAKAAAVVCSADFFLDQHARIFTRMLKMADAEIGIDIVTLTDSLHRDGQLEEAGGAPYICSLPDGMPRSSNIEFYAQIVKELAVRRNLIHLTHNIQMRAWEGEESPESLIQSAAASVTSLAPANGDKNRLVAVDVLDFLTMALDPIDFMFEPILPVSNSAMVFSPSGAGKTYIMLYMNYSLAVGAPQCFVWDIPRARPVVYVDGEMDQLTLQERQSEIAKSFLPVLPERGFMKIITPDQQPKYPPRINTKEGRARIEEHCVPGCLLTLDNLFTLCPGGDDKDTEDWAIIQEWILYLRKNRIAVFVVQHANAGGERQHGSSKREVQLSCNLMLRVASDYTPEEGLRVEARLKKLRRRGKDGRWDPRWAQPFEISYRVADGVAQFSTRPMLEILKKKALELLVAGAHPKEVMESTGLDRFVVYRLRSKLRTDGAAAAAGVE